MKAYEQTLSYLKTLSLRGIVRGFDELLNDAEARKSSYLAFLNTIFSAEIDFRIKVSLIVTSNKSFETWAEMMGDTVMTTALLDRLLHHAKVFTLDGESYRIKKSRKEV